FGLGKTHMPAASIRRLSLTNFRSYRAASIELDGGGPVVLTGQNGAGKTNFIEAISFFAPGRGLRRATLDEVAFSEGDGAWAGSAEIEGRPGWRHSAPEARGALRTAQRQAANAGSIANRSARRRLLPIICAWCG